MELLKIVDDLRYIEGIIYDLIDSYVDQAQGLENDVTLVISTVQELRFALERSLGI